MSAISPIGRQAPQDDVEHPLSGCCEGQKLTAADAANVQSDSELYEEQEKEPNEDLNKVNPSEWKF